MKERRSSSIGIGSSASNWVSHLDHLQGTRSGLWVAWLPVPVNDGANLSARSV